MLFSPETTQITKAQMRHTQIKKPVPSYLKVLFPQTNDQINKNQDTSCFKSQHPNSQTSKKNSKQYPKIIDFSIKNLILNPLMT